MASRQWANLKALLVDSTIRDRYVDAPLALLEATHPYKPFDVQNWTANTLARAARSGKSFAEAREDLTQKRAAEFRTPIAEWLYDVLRPVFDDQLPDDDDYEAAFDRAEVMLGVLAQDAFRVRIAATPDQNGWGRSHWFGRSTWRTAQYHGNPVDDMQHELAHEGVTWGPLRAELFGGEIARAKAALDSYGDAFAKMTYQHF